MNRNLGLLLTVALSLALSACASSKKTEDTATDTGDTSAPIQTAEPTVGTTGLTRQQLSDLGIYGDPLDEKVVYFEYNSSVIDRRSEVIASAHARELAARGGAAVNLAGHADERGTRGYNLALGERRAQAVENLMNSVGTGGSNVQTISYGEERPVEQGHNEAAWAKNRRVEISY
jgi:peptidoglycan-associated lipoprotein